MFMMKMILKYRNDIIFIKIIWSYQFDTPNFCYVVSHRQFFELVQKYDDEKLKKKIFRENGKP